MNERALPITNVAETDWVATDLDQTVSQELHGRTEQPLTLRVFLWRLLAVGLNLGLFMILFQLYKLVRKTAISHGETVGFGHAVDVINLEKRLHVFFEPDLQRCLNIQRHQGVPQPLGEILLDEGLIDASILSSILTVQKSNNDPALAKFASTLEKVCIDTVEAGYMTKDLALLVGADQKWLSTTGFLDKVDENLKKAMGA